MVISLAEIEKTIAISKYAVSLPYSMKCYKLDPDIVITKASAIPKFILKLRIYFLQVKLKKGKSYTKLHFTYSIDLEDIIDNLKEELLHYTFLMYKQIL